MANILSKVIYVSGLPSNDKMEGTVMVSKDFVLNIVCNSKDISSFQKEIIRSIEELSLVYKATHYCQDIEELKDFLKY